VPATCNWIGTVNSNWSNSGNWQGGVAPSSNDTVVFDTTTVGFAGTAAAFAPNNDITGLSGLTIIINDASAARDFNLKGNAVGLGAAGITSTVSSGNNATEAMALTLSTATTITANAGSPLVVSGVISGGGSLTSAGAGTLTLSGNNSAFTGGVNVNAGTLIVTANNALGDGSAATTVANGAILQLNGVNYTTAQPLTLAAGGSLVTPFGGPPSSLFAGTITNQGTTANPGIIISGANSPLTLTGGIVNTAANAGLNINPSGNGNLTINAAGISTPSGNVTMNVLSGGLQLNVVSSFSGITTVSPNAAIDVTVDGGLGATGAGNDLVLSGVGNPANLVFDGGFTYASPKNIVIIGSANIQSQNGNNTFAGTVNATVGGSGFTFVSNTVGDLFTVTGGITTNNNPVSFGGPGYILVTSNIAGTEGVAPSGNGTVTLAGTNSYTGGTNPVSLLVTGSLTASAINIPVGRFVGGTGTVQSINVGGILAPGVNGVGTLTADGTTSFSNSSAQFVVQLDGSGGSSTRLQEAAGASVSISQGSLVVNQTTPTSTGQTFTIISGASSISGTFAGLANNANFASGGRIFRINYTATTVTLTDVGPAVLHWIGSSAANGNLWNVAANWLENAVPVSGDALIFDPTTAGFSPTANGFAPVNNIAGLTNLTLTINDTSGAGDFNLTGTTIGLASGGITSTVSNGANATEAMNLTLPTAATALTVNAGDPLIVSGQIQGAGTGPLTVAGAGTLVLNGGNSFDGGINLSGGIVQVGISNALGSGALTISNNAVLESSSNQALFNSFIIAASGGIVGGSNSLTLGSTGRLDGTLTITNSFAGVGTTLSGQLSGAGGLTVNTGAVGNKVTLTGSVRNSFTGPTLVTSGTLNLNEAGALAIAGNLTINSNANVTEQAANQINNNSTTVTDNGTLNLGTFVDTIGALTGSGVVQFSSATSALTIGNNLSGPLTYNGTFSGAGSLSKVGADTLTLSGNSGAGYTGTTSILAGTLSVTGNYSGSPVIVNGGTLAGTGTVQSILGATGTVSPAGAVSIGTLSTAGGGFSTTLNGTVYQVDVNTPATSDQLSIGNGATINLDGATLNVNVLGSVGGNVYTIVSSSTGGISGTFSGRANGTSFTAGTSVLQIAYTSNAVTLIDIGMATSLAFAQQPSNGSVGSVIAPPITVQVLNQNGVLFSADNGRTITIAISANPGVGVLGGTVSALTVNGVATFNNLTISAAGTGYSLAAGATGLSGATSAAFNITAPPPAGGGSNGGGPGVGGGASGSPGGASGSPGGASGSPGGSGSSSLIHIIATGAGAGAAPEVNVYDAATGVLKGGFLGLPARFTGGARVAVADVNGDGTPDIIVGAGPGAAPQITVYDGKTFQPILSFYGLPVGFTGGVFVAAGDVNGDGFADIIVSADRGGGPQVTITSGRDGTRLASFYATAPTFTGGIRVACADINGDGFADVIAAAGPGGGPQVTIFDGKSMSLLTAFYALPSTFTGGMFVAAGDVNGDGRADILIGAEKGGGPEVSVFNGPNQQPLGAFFALTPTFTGGVRVAAAVTTGSGHASILAAAGPGGGSQVGIFDGLSLQLLNSFFAYPAGFVGGVFVAGN
jgi:autotransporter-associated beta strand protein